MIPIIFSDDSRKESLFGINFLPSPLRGWGVPGLSPNLDKLKVFILAEIRKQTQILRFTPVNSDSLRLSSENMIGIIHTTLRFERITCCPEQMFPSLTPDLVSIGIPRNTRFLRTLLSQSKFQCVGSKL